MQTEPADTEDRDGLARPQLRPISERVERGGHGIGEDAAHVEAHLLRQRYQGGGRCHHVLGERTVHVNARDAPAAADLHRSAHTVLTPTARLERQHGYPISRGPAGHALADLGDLSSGLVS